jgi:hypothetical protein
MLVFKTEVISKFSFPAFPDEKFVPEAFLYDKIDTLGKLYVLREYLYNCEYTSNGLTANITNLIKKNPSGYLYFLQHRIEKPLSFLFFVMDYVRYCGLLIYLKENKRFFKLKNRLYYYLLLPLSYLYYLKRFK